MLLVGNGKLFTRDSAQPYLENGAVVMDGEIILEVGDFTALRAKYPNAEYVDAKGGLIMPGFINAHTHIYSGLARGLSIAGKNSRNFIEVLEDTWWNIDRHLTIDGTKACAYATVLDSIRNGVTTIVDHHASFCEIPGSLFAIKDVCQELGIRANLCYEVSERDGAVKCEESIRENAEFSRWAAAQNDDMITAMFGGHALFTISNKTFEKMVAENNGLTGFHIHVAEGLNDVYDSLNHHRCYPIERLERIGGILGEKTMLGHCIHLTDSELDTIAQSGTMVVNNPESNMGNAVGICPVLPLYKHGILLGMGTDAYTNDMLESLKVALCSQRHNACLPNVGWCEVTDMLFKNNAKMAERSGFPTLGVLKAGAAADVIVMDYKPFTPFSDANIDGHMIFGMTGRQCQTTMINGKILMKDRVLTEIDEEAVNARILEVSKKFWGKLNHCEY